MFYEHQKTISKYARADPDNFGRVMQFVILTVQQSLKLVQGSQETIDEGGPEALGILYGWKFNAYRDAWEHRQAHYDYCEHLYQWYATAPRPLAHHLLDYLASLTGFGLVKAGFVAQLVYGHAAMVGCIDSHNMRRFGIMSARFARLKPIRTAVGRRRKISAYLDICEAQGGSAALWDGWCAYVADRQPTVYRDAHHVSRLHCEALGL